MALWYRRDATIRSGGFATGFGGRRIHDHRADRIRTREDIDTMVVRGGCRLATYSE
jgi:hypothetical protein